MTMPPEVPRRAIVILGAAVWPGEQASPTLQRRVNRAIALWQPGDIVVPSGGLGQHPPTEAEVMRRLLRAAGIPDTQIRPEDRSISTLTNARLSAPLLTDAAEVIVVTDGYHCLRARLAFSRVGLDVTTISADPAHPRPRRSHVWRQTLREAFALPLYLLRIGPGR